MAAQWYRSEWGIQLRLYLTEQVVPPGEQMPLPGMPQEKITGRWRMFPWLIEVLASSDGELRAGREYMAQIAGAHPTTVSKWCSKWVAAGWLIQQVKGHNGTVSVYQMVIPEWAVKGGADATQQRKKGGARATQRKTKGGVSAEVAWRNSATPEEEKSGRANAQPTTDEPSGSTPQCPSATASACKRGKMCPVHGPEIRQANTVTDSEVGMA